MPIRTWESDLSKRFSFWFIVILRDVFAIFISKQYGEREEPKLAYDDGFADMRCSE